MKVSKNHSSNKTIAFLAALVAVNTALTTINTVRIINLTADTVLNQSESVIIHTIEPEETTIETTTTEISETSTTEMVGETITISDAAETTVSLIDETDEYYEAVQAQLSWEEGMAEIDSGRVVYEIPDLDNTFKSYMSYKKITNKSSKQYAMQQDAWTDENGLRRYGDAYMVAVGTYYADSCGVYFNVKTDKGNEFVVVTGDIKADCTTNSTHQYVSLSNDKCNILEFIVDTENMDSLSRKMGSLDYVDCLSGQIISIERIEE